jgi:tetratricopeptide (TPR) repeat protein
MLRRDSNPAGAFFLLTVLSGVAVGQGPEPKAAGTAASDQALREAVTRLDEADGDVVIRARLWCEMAAFRRVRGDRDGAVAALVKARTVAESGKRPPIDEWRQIGQGYAQLGDAKAVLDLIEAVPVKLDNWRGNPRETVLGEAARAAAVAGHIKPAEQIADALPEGTGRKSLRENIARQAMIHQAAGGDATGAIKAATKLPSAADTVFALVGRPFLNLTSDDDSRTDGIAPAQLAAGGKEGAMKTTLSALALLREVDDTGRASAALAVVRMLARLDNREGARMALAQMPAADAKAEPRAGELRRTIELIAKGYLAAAEVRAGKDDAALALAADFSRVGDRAYILHFVALAQARAGRKDASAKTFAQAIDLVAKTPDPDGAGTSLHNIATAQAAAGDFTGAAKTAGLQPGGTIAWSNLAYFQAQAGDFTAARKAATDHLADSPFWSARTLQFVAEKQARAGQEAAAREWIGKLDDRLIQAYALFGLAKGLSPERDRGPAKR